MRRISISVFAILLSAYSFAQVGIGTTNPNTTLDVRGSLAANSRSFSTTVETVLSTDFALLFTGNSACTLTLPDATGCIGRIIHLKNTKTGTVPVLTIATTASQTIDGLSSILLNDPNESVNLVSDGSNWKIMGQSLPTGSGTSWTQGGNTVGSIKKLGTLDSYDLPFITNNVERMRITSAGRVAIGTTTFDATNPEKLLVDAGSTSSFNVISGKGTIDNYLQLNIQNKSGTGNASSDLVATADNGTESINYVDLGINSSAYTNTSYPIIGGANNVYLYGTGNDFAIGNGTSGKNLQFFTGGYALTNERMRITSTGNIGINNTSPSEKLDVTGNIRFSGAFMPNNSAGTAGYVLVSSGAGAAPTWQDGTNYVTGSAWVLGGNNLSTLKNFGTTSNYDLPFITNSVERMRLTATGLGIGITAPSEKLDVAGNIHLSGTDRAIFFDATMDPYAGIKTVTRSNETTELMLFAGNDVAGSYGADRIRLASQEIHFATSDVGSSGINNGDPTSFYSSTSNVPTRMIINEDGNVGIGTTTFNSSNAERLIVDAGSNNVNAFQNVIVGKGNTNSYAQLNIQNLNSGTGASSDVVATADNGNESVNYIDMGINSSTFPTGTITGGANNAYLYSTGNDFVVGNATANKNLIFFTGGTATTNEKLRITTTAVLPGTDNTLNLGSASKRWNTIYAGVGGFVQSSDARLKTNIHSLTYGLKEVLNMEPVSYNFKNDPNGVHKIGLLAQQVRKVVPEVVVGNEEKESLGMNYSELVPVLVNAIKEQQREIEDLKQRVKALEHQ